MKESLIFDFFGVFCPDLSLDWFRLTAPNYESKLDKFFAYCTESDYGRLSRKDFYKAVSALAGTDVKTMEKGIEARTVIDQGLVDYTRKLKSSGYQIACLSNGTHEWTLQVIDDHGLRDLFDEIVLSADLGVVKPDPEIYYRTLDKLGARPSETVFIDDRQPNVDAANKLEIAGVLFTNTANLKGQLAALGVAS